MNTPSPDVPKFRPKNLIGVLLFLKRYSVGTSIAIGLLLFNIGLEMTLPRISGTAINRLRDAVTNHTAFNPWFFAELFLGLAFVRSCVGFGLGRLRNRLVQGTLRDIRAAYFDAVQRLSFTYHNKTNTGELISRGTADISRLQDFLFACLFLGIDISFAMIMSVILITLISPMAGLATLLTLGPTVGLIVYFARQLHPRFRKMHDRHGEMTTAIQENIAGVRVVKAFARERDEISKFQERRDVFLAAVFDVVNYWAGRVPMAQFVFGLSMPLVLWIGGSEVISGKLLVGNLATIVLYLVAIGNRMNAIGQVVNIIQNASASSERVMEVLEEPLKMHGGTKLIAARGGAEVTFQDVSFQYPGSGGMALKEISFVAKPGQVVAVLGATGAGKSTLVHLIPRFYDPTAGRMLIDGIDLRELDLRELRRSVGMIFQETVLFSATVAENIAYGRSEATPEQIVAAARAAHAHDFITQLDRGYDTVIGERGVSLSGGQKQRMAIARTFLLDPLILILDDATSSLDSKTERLIQEDMRRVCYGRTAFIIAHRLTTVQHADHIIVLHDGCIVEQGTPAELMKQGVWLKDLFREQVGRSAGRGDFERGEVMSDAIDVLLEEALAQKPLSLAMIRRLMGWARPYRTAVVINIGATILSVLSQLMGPKLIQIGIDKYLTHIATRAAALEGIFVISAIYLGNLLVNWRLTVAQVKSALQVGEGIMNDLRLAVFRHIQLLSLSYFDKTHQGRIINRADADIDGLDQVLTWGANQFLSSVLTLVGVLFMMVRTDWRLCLAVSVVLPPLAIATYLFQKFIMQAHRHVRQQSSRLTASLAENISGVRVVQSMGREDENLERYLGLHRVFTARNYDVARVFHTFMPTLGLVSGVGTAIVLGYGGYLAMQRIITIGDLALFILYVQMFFGPVQIMGDLYNGVLSAGASAERIFQLLDTEPQVVDKPNAGELPSIAGNVRFEGVSFRYEATSDDRWILEDIDFRADAGQTVALVGHTGSGKTSIISLLARFYEPQFGRILIDGVDVSTTTIESLHRQLGIVTQENFLFTGTIMDNLRFGRPEASDAEVESAAKSLGTDEIIRHMKEGFLTKVGERGGNLSAGERQLLCITRALVARPRILILDEATSAVDSKSEALIQAALDILLQGRTTFVIAHRLSTVRKASPILVLQQGKIVERGTHDSLIAAGGVYAGLYEEFSRST